MTSISDLDKLRQVTIKATGANSWRPEGIYYKKNNIYVDVNETVNLVFGTHDEVLKFDIEGSIMVNCELSGMPEC